MSKEVKRLQDYIDTMHKEDYDEWFANIEDDEKQLRKFLNAVNKIDENILIQVAGALNDTWNLPYEHKNIVDFIVDLYKCELTEFYDGGAEEYIDDIKMILEEETDFCDIYVELEEVFEDF